MLNWAVHNLQAFKNSQQRFHLKRPYGIWADSDPQTGETRIRVSVAEFIDPPEQWVYQIGDIVHNMRVSLDYLAFSSVSANLGRLGKTLADVPPAEAKRIAFPVSSKDSANEVEISNDWKARVGDNLKWASDRTKLQVEAMQVHRRGQHSWSWALHALSELDNPHKHRDLLAAAPAVVKVDYKTFDGATFEVTRMGVEGPFKDGAVVARGHVMKPAGGGDPRVEVYVAFEVAFGDVGPASGWRVLDFLGDTSKVIRSVFDAVEATYL